MGKLLKLLVVACGVGWVPVWAQGLALSAAAGGAGSGTPIKIKVVVVATFEVGEDTGDAPGEFQYWVEREKLTEKVDFPGGVRALRMNAAHDVLGVVTGMTLANAGASLVALGLDPRFDLSHAYWLVDGIAGVDPADGTIGTAAWASYVVNDVNRQVDSAEKPAAWPYGLFVIGAKGPNEMPAKPMTNNAYALNEGLAGWAYGLTKDSQLPDNAAMAADRVRWVGFPNAMKPPTVIRGDSFASDSYWHGKVMTQYANDWVKLWTKGKGNFAMANMEDSGIAEALERLERMHRADYRRLMVLRVASNYSMQAPGQTAVESVTAPYIKSTAFECAWVTGSVVVRELVGHWDRYEGSVPGR
jgi:purine nucleoside permease